MARCRRHECANLERKWLPMFGSRRASKYSPYPQSLRRNEADMPLSWVPRERSFVFSLLDVSNPADHQGTQADFERRYVRDIRDLGGFDKLIRELSRAMRR